MIIALTYLAAVVFGVGLIIRARKISKMPVHLRWELAPVPHEKGKGHYGGSYFEEYEWWTKKREKSLSAELWYMFQEMVFLKGMWEKNRTMWYFSFPFHFGGLYLLFAMVGLLAVSAILSMFGIGVVPILKLANIMATVGCLTGLVGTSGLLMRRLIIHELKSFSSFGAYFNLLFLMSIYLSGLLAVNSASDYAGNLSSMFHAIFTFQFGFSMPMMAAVHVALACAFFIYLPFTYMMHFVAKYFTYHEVRWNDEPMTAGSNMEKEVGDLLGQKITWAADHIKGEGKKTWVDAATEEVEK